MVRRGRLLSGWLWGRGGGEERDLERGKGGGGQVIRLVHLFLHFWEFASSEKMAMRMILINNLMV